jgi:hypothetical protein
VMGRFIGHPFRGCHGTNLLPNMQMYSITHHWGSGHGWDKNKLQLELGKSFLNTPLKESGITSITKYPSAVN